MTEEWTAVMRGGLERVVTFGRLAPLFPVRISRHGGRWHKEPAINRWQERATAGGSEIRAWFKLYGENFGVHLGGARLVVIDADRHEGRPDGVVALADLVMGREWPSHPIVGTAGGGEHHVFEQPEGHRMLGCGRGALPEGIDVRGNGGWVVRPGSVRSDGARWETLADAEVPPLPEWLRRVIRESARTDRGPDLFGADGDGSLHGPLMAVNNSVFDSNGELPKRLYAKLLELVPLSETVTRQSQRRVAGILGIALEREHHRNDGLNIAAFCMRELIEGGVLRPSVAAELLLDVATLNGYVAKDGERAALATIQSGLGSGEC
jgi:hypothetical protein